MTETPRIRSLVRVLLVPTLLALVVGAAAGGPGWIRVKRGDTLSELAVRYHTSVAALRELNHLGGNNLIFEGQLLRVGRVPVVAKAAPRQAALRRIEVTYVVRPGDGVYRIATHFHADPRWLAKRNNLPRSLVVHPGQRLVVGSVMVRPGAARAAAPQRVSKAYVRSLIVREARAAGVPVDLALALAYNESGFQQHVVSSVGAVGALQVMPGTGAWVSKYLVGRPLDLRRAEDNVTAGVRYFAMLRRIAGRDDLALAGYYQGLASVRAKGMYDDTKAYVANILALRHRFAG
ncbi:MAG TPA: LysM peptidoglycan-binding domain-containing protein [Mycobacteriales bacterium]|jgi:soluble lytic murein transglycosylase-like protein|nr:LysM peptidoglycan-binding domain-containing protein [Mycobacteriales bacterium]